MAARDAVEGLGGQLFVREEEDGELGGEEGRGGWVAGAGGVGDEWVGVEGGGEGGDPAVGVSGGCGTGGGRRVGGILGRGEGGCEAYFCTPTRASFFWNPCTNAGMASRAVELREGDALIVFIVVMSYSPHWR